MARTRESRDRANAAQRLKYKTNEAYRERVRENARRWYLENKEHHLKRTKAWKIANWERVDATSAKWTKANRKRRREIQRKSRIKCLVRWKGHAVDVNILGTWVPAKCLYCCGARARVQYDLTGRTEIVWIRDMRIRDMGIRDGIRDMEAR